MDYGLLLLIVSAVFLGSLMRTTFGFGDSVVSMPLLALLPIPFSSAVALVGLVGFTVALFSVFSGWKNIDRYILKQLFISTILGIPFGLLLVYFVERRWVSFFLGILLILYASYSLLSSNEHALSIQTHFRQSKLALPFGFASGMLGSAYNMNGIPIVLYGTLRNWPPKEFKDNLQAHFLLSSTVIIFSHFAGGFWTSEVGLYYLFSIPAVFLAILIGNYLYSKIRIDKFRRLVIFFILLLGLFTLIDSLTI